jgi:hypothetical protein
MSAFSGFLDEAARIATDLGAAIGLGAPVLRLGVTGRSRAGKTVFITALVQALVGQGKLPAFAARAEGRIKRAYLMPQPDDAVPRFAYEDHLATLTGPERAWPQSTRRISELRVMVEYESRAGGVSSLVFGKEASLVIDIVDYPGEWLLDLALLRKSYAEWSAETLLLALKPPRDALSAAYRAMFDTVAPDEALDESRAKALSDAFTAYLRACRSEEHALSALPPGRFLLPGDLEGSPALTFAPLPADKGGGGLRAAFERRYESYKSLVVKPFFRDHFARLDRQIVLVDVLSALNAGSGAMMRSLMRSKPSGSAGRARSRAFSRRASERFCSRRPRRTRSTTPAMTGSRRSSRCSPGAPWLARRGAGQASMSWRARRRSSQANCRTMRKRLSPAISRDRSARCASCRSRPCAPPMGASSACRRFASTVRSNSWSATG